MFDFGVGYSEMFVLALIAIIVIGPKDLPKVLRTFGRFMQKMRGMAREFQGHVDEAMKDTGLDEIKSSLKDIKSPTLMSASRNEIAAKPAAKDNSFEDYFGAKDGSPAAEPKVKS
jgi:sec-independent protein translocase protein TatB